MPKKPNKFQKSQANKHMQQLQLSHEHTHTQKNYEKKTTLIESGENKNCGIQNIFSYMFINKKRRRRRNRIAFLYTHKHMKIYIILKMGKKKFIENGQQQARTSSKFNDFDFSIKKNAAGMKGKRQAMITKAHQTILRLSLSTSLPLHFHYGITQLNFVFFSPSIYFYS